MLFNASSYCTDQISIRTNSITSPKIKTAVDQSPGCASVGLARQFLYIGSIVNGGETNYIMATYGLYLSIFNIFISSLQLLGIFGGDD